MVDMNCEKESRLEVRGLLRLMQDEKLAEFHLEL